MQVHDYMWSLKGHNISLSRPKPEDIDLETGAIVLSRICRFGGHSRIFYSVAQHCIHVANLMMRNDLGRDLCLHGLLHDFSEYILQDLIRPVKYHPLIYAAYKPIEEKFMKVIARKFGFKYNKQTKERVKFWERKIEMAEIRDLMNISEAEKAKLDFGVAYDIPDLLKSAMRSEIAEVMFLKTYYRILKMPI